MKLATFDEWLHSETTEDFYVYEAIAYFLCQQAGFVLNKIQCFLFLLGYKVVGSITPDTVKIYDI